MEKARKLSRFCKVARKSNVVGPRCARNITLFRAKKCLLIFLTRRKTTEIKNRFGRKKLAIVWKLGLSFLSCERRRNA